MCPTCPNFKVQQRENGSLYLRVQNIICGKAMSQTLSMSQALQRKWPELWWPFPACNIYYVIISLIPQWAGVLAGSWLYMKTDFFEEYLKAIYLKSCVQVREKKQRIVKYPGAGKGRLTLCLNRNKECICLNLEVHTYV